MPVSPSCIAAVRGAVGDKLTDQEAKDVIERVEAMQKRQQAEGQLDRAEERLRQAARDDAEKAKIEAAMQAKHWARSVMVRQEAEAYFKAYLAVRPGKYQDAALSYLEGSNRQFEGARASVAATALAYERMWHGAIMGAIAKEKPHLEKMLGDEAFNVRVAIEMGELKEGGNPGRTGDQEARWLAKVYADTAELSRRELNRLGANIGKLDGWHPQRHDAWRLLRAGRSAWVQAIRPLLDEARSFPDTPPEKVDDILGKIWKTIATGRDDEVSAREKGQVTGPANLAKRLGEHRFLHFRDTEAWLSYNKAFGYGNLSASMFSHLQKAARLAGQMERLGPNPQAMMLSLVERLQRQIKKAFPDEGPEAKKALKEIEALSNIESWGAWGQMTGLTNTPANYSAAAAGSFWRAWQATSKLGLAIISSITDPVTLINNLRFQGKGALSAYGEVFSGYLRGRGKDEQRHVGFLLGEGFQGIIDQHLTRYAILDTPPGWMSRGMTTFFRWSGLTGWTDTGRAVAARVMAADMGARAQSPWAELPERYRLTLELQGFNAAKWEAIRGAAWQGQNGASYLTPDRMKDLPDEAIEPLVADELARIEERFAGRLAKLQATDASEAARVKKRIEKLRRKIADTKTWLDGLRAKMEAAQGDRAAEIAEQVTILQNRIAQAEMQAEAIALPTRAVKRAVRIGEKIGRADRRIKEAQARVRSMQKTSERALNKIEDEATKRLIARDEEVRAFIETMQERHGERLKLIEGLPALKESRLKKARDEARFRLELDLHRFYADEAAFGIIEVDAAAKRATLLGSQARPGTLAGELIRAIMQFKGFPIAFTQRVLGRAWYAGPKGRAKWGHMGELMAGLFVAGLFAMWGKDVAKGKDPRELTDDSQWLGLSWKTIAAAIVQSGGAGIYGDFLFAEVNRFGASPLENLAGPAFGEASHLVGMIMRAKDGDVRAADWLNFVLRNTPFANLHAVRPGLDYLFLNSLREAISPGFLSRQEQRARQDFNQGYWMPRTAF